MVVLSLLIAALFLSATSCWVHVAGAQGGDACIDNDLLTSVFTSSGVERRCIIKRFNADSYGSEAVSSTVRISTKPTSPKAQAWMRCRNCALLSSERRGNLKVDVQAFFDDKDSDEEVHNMTSIDASWSQWGTFFVPFQNDRFTLASKSWETFVEEAKVLKSSTCDNVSFYTIDRPVFVLPIVDLHVGHVLVDVLEQVYHTMMKEYGQIRRDALIVLERSGKAYKPSFQKTIYEELYQFPSALSLIHLFTELPVISIDTFQHAMCMCPNNVIKASSPCKSGSRAHVFIPDLHIGLDISESSYNLGSRFHPTSIRGDDSSHMQSMSNRYRDFQSWIATEVMCNITDITDFPQSFSGVLVVQRKGSRAIMHLAEVVSILREATGLEPLIVNLNLVPFSRQLQLLKHTKILVAVAGTALHNMLFMLQRPAAVIALMQQGWCNRAWMYVNQAYLLGIEPIVVCAGTHDSGNTTSDLPVRLGPSPKTCDAVIVDVAKMAWREGPLRTKLSNVSVSLTRFADAAATADSHVKQSIYYRHQTIDNDVRRTGDVGADIVELFLYKVSPVEAEDALGQLPDMMVLMEMRFGKSVSNVIEMLLESHPSLCVRSKVLGIGTDYYKTSNCRNIRTLELYAPITVPLEGSSDINLHFWLQTSPSGFKIEGSDLYISLDSRISDLYGFDIVHSDEVQKRVVPPRGITVPFHFSGELDDRDFPLDAEDFEDGCYLPHQVIQRAMQQFVHKEGFSDFEALRAVEYITRMLYNFFSNSAQYL